MIVVERVAVAVGCWLVGGFLVCAAWAFFARWNKARSSDDVMAVADAVQAPRRLCPPPRGPEDDDDFMRSLRGNR